MTVTVLDILGRLPRNATEHRVDQLNAENPIVTIITEVPRELAIHTDFDLNGKIIISAPYNDVIRKYGSTAIDELCDFTKHNAKICWSAEPVTAGDEGALFRFSLTLRLISFDQATNTVNYTALRNKYGSSTIVLTEQIEK